MISSIRTPAAPVAETLLSVAARHFNLIGCPLAVAGRVTVEVIYAGAAVVPPESPLHAIRPPIGLPNAVEIVAL
jgi:hypothetical protein